MTSDLAQTAYDKLEIKELITRYAFTYDAGHLDEWASLFTDDVVWELRVPIRDEPLLAVTGKKDFVERFSQSHGELMEDLKDLAGLGAFHLMCGTVFDELTETTARARTMVAPLMQNFNDDGSVLDEKNWHEIMDVNVLFGGIYHGWYRKVDGEWKIAKKIFFASPKELDLSS